MHREVKQAAINVAIVLAVLLAAGAIGFVKVVRPKLRTADTLGLIHNLQKAAAAYHEDHGTLPTEERALIEALRGNNAERKDYLGKGMERMIVDGLIHDPYGTPLRQITEDPIPRFASAGPDLTHGTGDDLSDDDLAEMFRRYGMFRKGEKPPLADRKGKPH